MPWICILRNSLKPHREYSGKESGCVMYILGTFLASLWAGGDIVHNHCVKCGHISDSQCDLGSSSPAVSIITFKYKVSFLE